MLMVKLAFFHTGIIQISLPEELALHLVEIYERDFLLKPFFKTRNISGSLLSLFPLLMGVSFETFCLT